MPAQLVALNARKRLFLAVRAIGAAGAWVWARDRELADPDVKRLYADCGNANGPPGLQMSSSPTSRQQFWTRQHWTADGELKVEVWEFREPAIGWPLRTGRWRAITS